MVYVYKSTTALRPRTLTSSITGPSDEPRP